MSGGDITMPDDIAAAEFASQSRPSPVLWLSAGVLALGLHLGGAALTMLHLHRETTSLDTLGAQAVEVGLEMGSPDQDDSDLPNGQGTEASVVSHAVEEQKAEVQPAERPKDIPTETSDPDQIVTPSDDKKPEETEPKLATSASVESVAAEATAKQSIDAALPRTNVAVAPNIGLGKDTAKLKAKWESKFTAYIQSHLRYPKLAKNKSVTVTVRLVLNRIGHVLSVGIAQSSGDPTFDEAALSTIQRSDPLPQPPAALTDEQFIYQLPMMFTGSK